MTPAQEARQNAMFDQQADLEQQEQRFYEIAGRLHSLVMMGAFDVKDFEDTLYGFGILTEWKKRSK